VNFESFHIQQPKKRQPELARKMSDTRALAHARGAMKIAEVVSSGLNFYILIFLPFHYLHI
jgi:hypothetical protein